MPPVFALESEPIRQLLKKEPIPEFKAWLVKRGIWENGHLGPNAGDPSIFFK